MAAWLWGSAVSPALSMADTSRPHYGRPLPGFIFYTNYTSRKGIEMGSNGRAAFTIYWEKLQRQIRWGRGGVCSPSPNGALHGGRSGVVATGRCHGSLPRCVRAMP